MTKNAIIQRALPMLFFPLTIIYEELLLRLFAVDAGLLDYHLLYAMAFATVTGLVIWALVSLLRFPALRLAVSALTTFVLVFIFCAQYICKQFFKTFFELNYMLKMSDNVTTDFASQTVTAILDGVPYILAAIIPLILLLVFRKKLLPEPPAGGRGILLALAVAAALELGAIAVIFVGGGSDKDYYTSDYNANSGISNFGLMGSTQLEVTYGIFGIPAP